MQVSFENLKYLVDVVSRDLIDDDFSNLLCEGRDSDVSELRSAVSDEIYAKMDLLSGLLSELCKYRPLRS